MTFEQADALCERIIPFMGECGYDNAQRLTPTVLSCLGARQFVIKIDRKGIRYFACYWKISRNFLQKIIEADETPTPENINSGPLMYVAEAASLGDTKEMVRRLRKKAPHGAYWYRPHKDRICRWKD